VAEEMGKRDGMKKQRKGKEVDVWTQKTDIEKASQAKEEEFYGNYDHNKCHGEQTEGLRNALVQGEVPIIAMEG
jgi:hypothetical protein